MPAPQTLADWPLGQAATVVALSPDGGFAARLGQLGVRPGMTVTPMLRTPGRGIVVGAGELRLALDRGSAHRVVVAERSVG
jgi:Fe2+ transport system protein FeoA